MKASLFAAYPSSPSTTLFFNRFLGLSRATTISNFTYNTGPLGASTPLFWNSQFKPSLFLFAVCSSNAPKSLAESAINRSEDVYNLNVAENGSDGESQTQWKVEVGSPRFPLFVPAAKLSLSDRAYFLLVFLACTTAIAFTSFVIAATPTLHAMGRAAISLSKLADTAREELPSTMVAVRLSGMEISDLTLELSDLSQEIADGVGKPAQAVQAAEAGIRQMGSLARQQTMSMIQERASLPIISFQPVVVGAAKKASRAVGQATKTFMTIISRGEVNSENEDCSAKEK